MLLRQIQHFQAIVQSNSFTEAAELCHISQSGISQSVKALEYELGVKLLFRKNRSFELTEAGKYFYRKSLVITADIEQLSRDTLRIYKNDFAKLSLGLLSTYSTDEFNLAIADFSKKHPMVELSVISGNHEELYDALRSERVDLVLNDQRRAFSNEYINVVLTQSPCYVEVAAHNPLAKGESVSVEELKNIPCILVASREQILEEEKFYRDIIGFRGEFLFADTLQAARVMVVSNRGVMPVEGNDIDNSFENTIKKVPLLRGDMVIKRTYCAFYKKEKSNNYVEEFAKILKSYFHSH